MTPSKPADTDINTATSAIATIAKPAEVATAMLLDR